MPSHETPYSARQGHGRTDWEVLRNDEVCRTGLTERVAIGAANSMNKEWNDSIDLMMGTPKPIGTCKHCGGDVYVEGEWPRPSCRKCGKQGMPETQFSASASTGPNPHYRPLVNRWRTVEIVCPFPCVAGVILDSELSGALIIHVSTGEEWPSNVDLEEGHASHPLSPDRPVFAVRSDERGPASTHLWCGKGTACGAVYDDSVQMSHTPRGTTCIECLLAECQRLSIATTTEETR